MVPENESSWRIQVTNCERSRAQDVKGSMAWRDYEQPKRNTEFQNLINKDAVFYTCGKHFKSDEIDSIPLTTNSLKYIYVTSHCYFNHVFAFLQNNCLKTKQTTVTGVTFSTTVDGNVNIFNISSFPAEVLS